MIKINHIKKTFLAIACITCCISTLNYADAFDDSFFDSIDNDLEMEDFFEQMEDMQSKGPALLIFDLLETLGIPALLQEDIYLRTNPLNKRSLLDQPLFPINRDYENNQAFGFQLFYNLIDKVKFTRKSTAISSYLAVTQETLIQKIDDLLNEIRDFFPDFNINPIEVLPLIKDMAIQQRQLGFMFHYMHQYKRIQLLVKTPLVYLERNEQLEQANKDALEAMFGAGDPDFQDQHLVSDKFGFGDTRIRLAFHVYDHARFDLFAGPFITLPTAFALKKGLKGAQFKKKFKRPEFNFEELFESKDTNLTTQRVSDFAIGALDAFNAIILDESLGNRGHVGIGAFTRTRGQLSTFLKYSWAERWIYNGFMSLEYLIPSEEKRCFKDVNCPEEFEFDVNGDEEKSQEAVQFLQEQFVNKFYPFVVNVTVHPRFVFRWSSNLTYEGKRFNFTLGSDTWMQGKETFGAIDANCAPRLAIKRGKSPFAYQGKLFTSFCYKSYRPERTWFIGFSIDGAFSETGIGEEYTASFDVIAHF